MKEVGRGRTGIGGKDGRRDGMERGRKRMGGGREEGGEEKLLRGDWKTSRGGGWGRAGKDR